MQNRFKIFIVYLMAYSIGLSCSLFTTNATAQCLSDGHSNVWNDAWISCQTSPNPNTARGNGHWILYDMGSSYFLGQTQVWNGNDAAQLDRGLKDVIIDYSMDGNLWTELGSFQFAQGSGSNNYMGFAGPDFSGIKAQFVLITVVSTWGDANCASLSEIKFDVEQSIQSNVQLSVLLEGPYNGNGTMKTDLGGLIPLTQVYNTAPYNYNGTESLAFIPSNMVDWVLVEVRQGTPNVSGNRGTQTIDTKAGVLRSNGSITGTDGNPLKFDLAANAEYHFCIRHRNHLDVVSATAVSATASFTYNFTNASTQALGIQQLKMSSDNFAIMHVGDYTQDGIIQTTDNDSWRNNPAQLNVYDVNDGTMDGIIQVTDYDNWFFNRAKIGVAEIGF